MEEWEDEVNGDTVRRGVGMASRLSGIDWPSFVDGIISI